jgi:hypothetical protein
MEHTIYLAAKAFIEKVNPRSPKTKNKMKTKKVEDDNDNEDTDADDEEEWLVDWIELEETPDEQEVDEVADFTAGNIPGKMFALVNQV